jgi:hypothetical protein
MAIATAADAPVLFVRRGLRPPGLAPPQTFKQFTWTGGGRTLERARESR